MKPKTLQHAAKTIAAILRRAWQAGWDARERGASLKENPYRPETAEYLQWIQGWRAYERNQALGWLENAG